ncbi:uncharacterized protein BYT42DRAFT_549530 [Radiomyces spectabilis]|uniref:uncharacterized protein n=1 Tax=Radiomyces spectabilis TaxID=64574 RepID=UPI00222089C6|nr:uncharacterized protein BYT42DRAFT_549530 [Radiomyces spectabilis]KAI8367487.1 hypothetical protein BYT42DRAFT_549530 [Radiomyces spectabilis]
MRWEGQVAEVSTTVDKPKKKKRAPPRRLPVEIQETKIWDLMTKTDARMSLAERIALDKQAARDIQDGIRFLHGRKPRARQSESGSSARPVAVNAAVKAEEEENSTTEESDDSFLFTTETDYETDEEGVSEFEYPYDFSRMDRSTPLLMPVKIKNREVIAVVDTGASVSVISKPLALELGLPFNEDVMAIEMLDETSQARTTCAQVYLFSSMGSSAQNTVLSKIGRPIF